MPTFKQLRKFRELIAQAKAFRTGRGYRDMARDPIVIPADFADCLRRVLVNIGSLAAGNNNADILKENSALLDELRKQGRIDKALYKTLYYRTKHLLEK